MSSWVSDGIFRPGPGFSPLPRGVPHVWGLIMNSSRWVLVVGLLIAVIGIAVAALLFNEPAESSSASGLESSAPEAVRLQFFENPSQVPDLVLETLDGTTLSMAELRGKVTLLNFWATWCGPCRAEIPDLVALQEEYGDSLQIIGISEDEGPIDNVRAFAETYRINYPIVMSTPEIQRAFPGVVALPTSLVVDREGRVVQRHVGLLDASRTEHQTRFLAGLPIDAVVEYVDPAQPVGLANAAQAKEIPGIDLSGLSPEQRVETLVRLNAEACTCGCGLTVAKCRIDDPACGVSLPLAREIVAGIAAARSPLD